MVEFNQSSDQRSIGGLAFGQGPSGSALRPQRLRAQLVEPTLADMPSSPCIQAEVLRLDLRAIVSSQALVSMSQSPDRHCDSGLQAWLLEHTVISPQRQALRAEALTQMPSGPCLRTQPPAVRGKVFEPMPSSAGPRGARAVLLCIRAAPCRPIKVVCRSCLSDWLRSAACKQLMQRLVSRRA